MDPHQARRCDVVYSADHAAALLGKTLAAERKSSEQSDRFLRHIRIRASQRPLHRHSCCSGVVLANEPRNLVQPGVHPHAHGFPHTIVNLLAALRPGLLPLPASHLNATMASFTNMYTQPSN